MKHLTVEKASQLSGLPRAYLYGAIAREPQDHPLPHIKSGKGRAHVYLLPETLLQWAKEEAARTVA